MDLIKQTHRQKDPQQLNDNFIKTIGDEWMLITAGSEDKFNTMTASWGTIGVLWNKPVAICFIRPNRYTYGFAEEAKQFTLSFFTEKEKNILKYCGTKSGKDVDKIKATGLTPALTDNYAIGFMQSRLCLDCKKIYFDDLKPENFLVPGTDANFYPKKDYHRMYIGEITGCYLREGS